MNPPDLLAELNTNMERRFDVAVLPAGQMGTILAMLAAENGHIVRLWCRSDEKSEVFNKSHQNDRLPGVTLPENIHVTSSLEEVVWDADAVILAPPSRFMRELFSAVRPFVSSKYRILSATKGLEEGTNFRMSQVIGEYDSTIRDRLAVLSGPNFATEIAKHLPAATFIASEDEETRSTLCALLYRPYFRVYQSDDVIGTELGGALKNPIAIAAGITDGLGLGDNARAGLISRGLAEMIRFGIKFGGRRETFDDLPGIGDLVDSCTSKLSRNYRAGLLIARGEPLEPNTLYEGFYTAKAVVEKAEEFGIEMPITQKVKEVVYDGLKPRDAARQLMERELI